MLSRYSMIASDWRKTRLAVDEHRHQPLGIELAEGRAVLLAAVGEQVHGHDPIGKALEIERDAHRGRRRSSANSYRGRDRGHRP